MAHYEGLKAIQSVAENNGKSMEEVRKDMQEAIDAAWSCNDIVQLGLQRQMFPHGKPTPEEFIEVMSHHISSEQ